MKLKIFFTMVVFCLSSASFAGEMFNHSCDPKSVWFDNKISSAVKTASLDRETLLKVDELSVQCHYEVLNGTSTYETAKCKRALELVGVN